MFSLCTFWGQARLSMLGAFSCLQAEVGVCITNSGSPKTVNPN